MDNRRNGTGGLVWSVCGFSDNRLEEVERMNDFEVRIGKDITRAGIAIIVFDRRREQNSVINLYTGETKVLKEFEEIPFEFMMKISNFLANDFLKALAEALDQQGIKTDKDAKIRIRATKYHLEDMKKLILKLK